MPDTNIGASDSQAGLEKSPVGERMRKLGSVEEVLARVDIDLAYSSEKLLNLEIFLMHVSNQAGDYEVLAIKNEDVSPDSVEKVLEFDLLSGILYSEVKELDNFMLSLQERISYACEKVFSGEQSDESYKELEKKLHDCENFLKHSQLQVADMRMQSAVFENAVASGRHESWPRGVAKFPQNSQLSSLNAEMKMRNVIEQQRNILGMLEASLARELDLEKKLFESKHNEEELKLKQHYAEQEISCIEEATDLVAEKFFEAENAAEVLISISKELMGKLQIVQFNLNALIQRAEEMRIKLQNSMQLETHYEEIEIFKIKLKEAECRCGLTSFEAVAMQEKVNFLEEQLRKSDSQLQLTKVSLEASEEQQIFLTSEINDLDSVMEDLRVSLSKAETQAESVESKCKLLAETNLELNEELGFLRNSNGILEKQLQQSDMQLEHAKASIEASEERQVMLYSALSDMENLIDDLKGKVLKAEGRVESAESKCMLLTDTNLELNEELSFLRSRIECLETSLHQVDDSKVATAKDIGVRTKVIADLIVRLAVERVRLHTQISSLKKEVKYWKTKNDAPIVVSHDINEDVIKGDFLPENESSAAQCSKSLEEEVIESSSPSFQVGKFAKDGPECQAEVESTISAEDVADLTSELETVQSMEAGQLNSKFILLAFLVLLIAVLAVYLFQQESLPF